MPTKANTSFAKRKNCAETKAEPVKKALKKPEILKEYEILQQKFEALEAKHSKLLQTNNDNLEAIRLLEETVTVLENKKNDNEKEHKKIIKNLEETVKELSSKCANKSVYLCDECDYLANCVHDFNDHTHSQDDLEVEAYPQVDCRFCDKSFVTLEEVMQHNKINHTSKVQDCSNFSENTCWFGENCWFLHREITQNLESSFKCKFCEKKFKNRNSLSEHMKMLHIQFVPKCKNEDDCKFYSTKKCWFVHLEDIEIAYSNAKNGSQSKNILNDME